MLVLFGGLVMIFRSLMLHSHAIQLVKGPPAVMEQVRVPTLCSPWRG